MATIVKLWDNGDELTLVTSGSGISISSDQNLTGSTRQKTIRIQTTDGGLYQNIVINQGIQSAVQDGYWVHKDTGVITYFGADADFITGGIMSKPSWATNASEVQIPSEVTSLFRHCFQSCSSLTSINIPEGVTSLGEGCFQYCYSLASITLSAGVTSIGNVCFMNCSSLTSITLPESLISLGQGSFNATPLTSITIPAGVTSIGMVCFYQCTSLTLVEVLPTIPPTLGEGVFNSVHSSLSIKVRSSYADDYKTASGWINYASKISTI